MTEFAGDTPATTGTLERNAQIGFLKSFYSFKTERIKVPDDFKIAVARIGDTKGDARTRTHSESPSVCRKT